MYHLIAIYTSVQLTLRWIVDFIAYNYINYQLNFINYKQGNNEPLINNQINTNVIKIKS